MHYRVAVAGAVLEFNAEAGATIQQLASALSAYSILIRSPKSEYWFHPSAADLVENSLASGYELCLDTDEDWQRNLAGSVLGVPSEIAWQLRQNLVFRKPSQSLGVAETEFLLPAENADQAKENKFPFPAIIGAGATAVVSGFIFPNPYSWLMIMIGPLILVVSFGYTKIHAVLVKRRLKTQYQSAISELQQSAKAAIRQEKTKRNLEQPSGSEWLLQIEKTDSKLWSEEVSAGLNLAVGSAQLPSRIVFRQSNQSPAKLDRVDTSQLPEELCEFAQIDEVQLVHDFSSNPQLAITGPDCVAVASAAILSLAAKYSPGQLRFQIIGDTADWSWIHWLPHNQKLNAKPAKDVVEITVVVQPSLELRRKLLAEPLGATIWLFERAVEVPVQCKTRLVTAKANANYLKGNEPAIFVQKLARISVEKATRLARYLAAKRDADLEGDSETAPVDNLLQLLKKEFQVSSSAELSEVLSKHYRTVNPNRLTATVGVSVSGKLLEIDLVNQGPHALIAGTTGSGKSEFLISWLLSLAINYPPNELTYILVDYKGGATFFDFHDLPHQVGIVSDLNVSEVARLFGFLSAELKYREQLLAKTKLPSFIEYRNAGYRLPRLVIVIDEAAAMVQELPDVVNELVNLAQRGRSLGIHLILATQRPAGAFGANLMANLALRFCFRTVTPEESQAIIASPDAAKISAELPGTGFVSTSHGSVAGFRALSNKAGDWEPRPVQIRSAMPVSPVSRSRAAGPVPELVDCLRLIAIRDQKIPERKPWLPELPRKLNGELLPKTAIGLMEEPELLLQRPYLISETGDQNLLVLGAAGTGKTNALAAIAHAAVQNDSCCTLLSNTTPAILLPESVTQIRYSQDSELEKLFHYLTESYGPTGKSIAALTKQHTLILDDFEQFRDKFEYHRGGSAIFSNFSELAAAGRQAGLKLVISSSQESALGSWLRTQFSWTVQLADMSNPIGRASWLTNQTKPALKHNPTLQFSLLPRLEQPETLLFDKRSEVFTAIHQI